MGRIRTEEFFRRFALLLAAAAGAFAIVYVLFLTTEVDEFGTGNWRTTNFGSAVHDPESFFKILLDALTFAGLLFIVASGFSLIFGLMRVVNMAHGSFYLLGGYIAYEVQQKMNPESQGFSTQPFQTSTWEWVLPLLVTVGCIAVFGLGMQQLLLRWNQGQDLRQALITIAVSVIVADQVIAHFPRTVPPGAPRFGGNAVSIAWPGWTEPFVDLRLFGIEYSLSRLLMLALGVLVGIALWLWLYKTKTGMVIRAGVDDRQMTAALGINIQTVFAIAFVVGAGLAARRRRRDIAGQRRPAPGRPVAALLARGGDRRRHGLAVRRRRGLAALRDRVHVLGCVPADDRQRLLHAVLDRVYVRAAGARARVPAARALRESRVTGSSRSS